MSQEDDDYIREQQEHSICKMIIKFCKLGNFKSEQVIELLKAQKAVPPDYTIDTFIRTLVKRANEPLRRSKPLVARIYVNGTQVYKVIGMMNEPAHELRNRIDVQVIVTEDF